jgi:serine palmitoyltransferase
MQNLRCILESIADDDKRFKRDTLQQRRFIIVEGIYRNSGDICPLSEIMRLKEEFCYRLILDESLSFGSLGKTGRGITEHFSVNITDVEVVVLTLDTSLASVGGVCIGSREIVDHQRLSGAGYCFSASAPPFLSAVASRSLKLMQQEPQLLEKLQKNSATLFDKLKRIEALKLLSVNVSPVFCLVLREELPLDKEREIIQKTAQLCVEKGVGISVSKFSMSDRYGKRRPSLMLCASATLSDNEISKVVAVLSDAISICL